MSEGIYQTNVTRGENLRELLKISYERCNQIKTINNQLLAIVVALFLGLFTIIFSAFTTSKIENNYLLIIAIHIFIFTLLIWRYYSHLIDYELVSCYKRILFCEEKLDIPFEISLASWLEKIIDFQLPPPYKYSDNLTRKKKYLDLNSTNKNFTIQKLIENNKGGYRFHNIWDAVAGFSIAILLFVQLFYYHANFDSFSNVFFLLTIYFPITYGLALWALTKDFKNNIPIQRDASNAELEEIIDKIAKDNNELHSSPLIMTDTNRSEDLIIKELNLIQDVIKRMASNSFLIKGWTITLIVATLLLKGSRLQILIAVIPLIAFWILDAYYLRQERLFRKLYEWVINNRKNSIENLFDLNTSRFTGQVPSLFGTMLSETLRYFYGSITFLLLIYISITLIIPYTPMGVFINGSVCIL
jgi:hypothetical protein